MDLPFTAEQFFGVFRDYNTTLWPVQLFLLALAGLAVILVLWPRSWSGVGVSAILAFLWGWMGLAYHLAFFTAISPPAYAFAAISVAGLQAAFLLSVPQDLGLAVTAVVGLVLVWRARTPAPSSPASAPEEAGAMP